MILFGSIHHARTLIRKENDPHTIGIDPNNYLGIQRFSYFEIFLIAVNACVYGDFLYSDLMLEPCDEVSYRGFEEFAWVIMFFG